MEIPSDHMLIEVSQHGTAAGDPTQEIADHLEASQNAIASQADFNETRRVSFDELSVWSVLEASEQPTLAQMRFCNHHVSSAVESGGTNANYAESLKYLPLWIAGKTNPIGIAQWAAYSPDESGRKRREKGLARAGNARVRRGMIQLAWRFLMFQKDSALAQWFRERTERAPQLKKKMIVGLARKLLIALWYLVRDGVVP